METASLIPPSKAKRRTIRQELNIEKWPLFAPSTFRGKSRELTREATLENGDRIKRKVAIGKTDDGEVGILRIADYKVFCALVELWEEEGKPMNENINFTLHKIAKSLKLQWGRSTYNHIHKALKRLKVIPITWEDSFYQKETDTMEKAIEYFNILENLSVFERREGDQLYLALSSFRLNSRIVSNLSKKYSKPLYLDVIVKFKKEISILLYSHLDLVMADKNYYERKTKGLFEDLELSKYKYQSQRKRLLEPALKELEGVELTTGTLSYAKLEKTVDGKDWKAVFKKTKKKLQIAHKKEERKEINQANLAIDIFNKRFPQQAGMLKEEMTKNLIEKHTLDKVVLHISRISNDGTVNNPAGLLRTSLEKDWDLPPTKEETQKKEKQVRDEREKKEKEEWEKEREKYLKEKEEGERLNKIFFSLSQEEQGRLKEEAKRIIIEQHIDDSQEKVSKFFLIDAMVMIKVREILRERERNETTEDKISE
ncbi:MAG: replication initiation protein [Candidatus Omnitrophica bacterium]|nr:replication initiation protein [Candidatus Omnitrophota bacterium]